jgi:pimeloyl-ACP methyl ester carboxylesterase
MREIERCRPTKKSQADEMLAAVEPDLMVRQFLLTNLVHGSGMHETARRYHEHYHAISTTNSLAFRVNLAAIQRTLLAMQKRATGTWDDGDVMPGQFDKPTLFIYGTRGDYVKEDRDGEEILRLFPKARLVGLPTGHWVHRGMFASGLLFQYTK